MKRFVDRGVVTFQMVFLVLAIVMFIIVGLAGFDILITLKDPNDLWGIAGFGLAFFAIAHLP